MRRYWSTLHFRLISAFALMLALLSTPQAQPPATTYDSAWVKSYFKALHEDGEREFAIIDIDVHRGVPNGRPSRRLWRVGSVFTEGLSAAKRFRCPAFGDSLDFVSFASVDLNSYFEMMQSAVPQYENGLYLSLVHGIPDSLRIVWHENIAGRGMLDVESAEWVPFGDPDSAVLAVVISQSSVGAGTPHGDTREKFWLRDTSRMWYLGQIPLGSYGGWGYFHRITKETKRKYEDVDKDGSIDLLISRTYRYGTGPNSNCEDRGWIALKPDSRVYPLNGGPDRKYYEGTLRAFAYLMDSIARPLPISRLPRLAFPKWDVPDYVPDSEVDSSYVKELDEMVFGDQVIKTMPWDAWPRGNEPSKSTWSGDGAVTVLPSLSDDNLLLEVTLRDDSASHTHDQRRRGPAYDVVFWTRPVAGPELIRFAYGGTLFAMIASPDSVGLSITLTQCSVIGGDSLVAVDTLGKSIRYLSQKGNDYSFVSNIPAEFTSLSEDTSHIGICLFAVEVISANTFGEFEPRIMPVSQSEAGFNRLATSSWGVLVEGRRTDIPPRRR